VLEFQFQVQICLDLDKQTWLNLQHKHIYINTDFEHRQIKSKFKILNHHKFFIIHNQKYFKILYFFFKIGICSLVKYINSLNTQY
jgi:hypothetical protein